MRMKYAIVGGDMRSILLAETLAADGHTVHCFANEKVEIKGCVECSCLPSCLYAADAVFLPIPAEKGGVLNAPFSDVRKSAEELLACLAPGQKLIGGAIDSRLLPLASSGGIQVFDLLKDESFAEFNALLTAEAALGLLIHDCDRAVLGSRSLVLGYGRIGKALSSRLMALGSGVTVAARSETALSAAKNTGVKTIELTELESGIGDFDFIINTVPARILSNTALCSADENAVFLELTSAPGGFDENLAKNVGLKVIPAPGLPGRFSPRSAAQYIKQLVYSAVNAGKE